MLSRSLTPLLVVVAVAAQAEPTLRYNYEYPCNQERIVIGHCRRDSDQPGLPPTQPQDDFCQVYYPGRPKTNGFEAMSVVLRGDLVQTLEACGALAAQAPTTAARPAPESANVQQASSAAAAPSPVAKLVKAGSDSYQSARKLSEAKNYKAANEAFASAAASFQQAIQLDPQSFEAHAGLGAVYLFEGGTKHRAAAIDSLKRAVAIRQDHSPTWGLLGQAYQFSEQYPEAVAAFTQSAKVQPLDPAAQFNLGYIYVEVGRYDDASRVQQTLLGLDKSLADRLAAKITKATQLSASWPTPAAPANPKIALVWIKPGSFSMGAKWPDSSGPVHRVSITKGFFLGKYEVTQEQWQMVMGANPSFFKNCGGTCPVEQVSWNDVQEFIRRLNALHDGYHYRLPSEAEWEYAYRAGTTSYFYATGQIGWSEENSGGKTHPVGGLLSNSFGLYDMAGNVAEWCLDVFHMSYQGAPVDGSAWLGTDVQNRRVVRNSSFYLKAMETSADHRNGDPPEATSWNTGFRVAASK